MATARDIAEQDAIHAAALLPHLNRLLTTLPTRENWRQDDEWYYMDNTHDVQGPFSGVEMKTWQNKKLLPSDLRVRKGIEGNFCFSQIIIDCKWERVDLYGRH